MAGVRLLVSSATKFAFPSARSRHFDTFLGVAFRPYSCLGSCVTARKNVVATGLPSKETTVPLRVRCYSDDRPSQMQFPLLMEYPQLLWPSVFKVFKNWIMAKFVITPYFDKDFNLKEFGEASQQAVEHVSKQLSKNDLDSLVDLVDKDALLEIRSSLSRFSVQQLSDLAINKEDIYFCFPYEVGVMFDEEEESQRRYVEITMVYFLMKGLSDYKAQHGHPPDFQEMRSPECQEKLYVLNYRFIREFTKGVPPEWTINVLNHYKGRPN
ncbi:Hypothetical predicted protein [Cloeon dipterum]|uniref:Tim44-like domain-containing protein n=2 Tax=Cloeon dipterum TaxID=197152 RepID=A0A8S1D2Y9_9INSE|nr:Hypothetical predicted protein [Cloeon dipterum]